MSTEVPEGFVEVEVVVGTDGKYSTKILRHGKKTACLHEDDKCILDELTGGIGEAEEVGNTDEYYEETRPDRHSQRLKPTDDAPFDEPAIKKKDKGIDLGYGV